MALGGTCARAYAKQLTCIAKKRHTRILYSQAAGSTDHTAPSPVNSLAPAGGRGPGAVFDPHVSTE
jgi:hypothetical protein